MFDFLPEIITEMKKGGHLGSCLMKDNKQKGLLWPNTETDGKQTHKTNEKITYGKFILPGC